MKALVLEKNKQLVYRDVINPVLADDECLVAVKYAGVCSSDMQRAYQNWAYFYPLVMGHEFAGEVVQIGALVTGYAPGDKVVVFPLLPCKTCEYCQIQQYAQCLSYSYYGSRKDGGFAEYRAVKSWNLLKLPHGMSLEKAAVIEPVAVAFHALAKANVLPHHKIAILGAGFIGLVTAHILAQTMNPHSIYLIDQDDKKLKLAAPHGFRTLCTADTSTWAEFIIQQGGVHTVFEMCGAVETFKQSLAIVKNQGHVVWVGNIVDDVLLEKKVISSILRKELTIKGSWNSSFTHDNLDDWHKALNYVQHSKELTTMITHSIPLDQAADFFESRMNQKDQELYIKAVFKI